MLKIITAFTLGLLAPVIIQAQTLEDLLVEKGVITKGEVTSARASIGGSKVYYRGGTRFEFPVSGFTSKINVQLQHRYEFTDQDSKAESKNSSSFRTRRARLQLSGTALNKEFSYKLQTDFVGDSSEDGARVPDLRDAYISWQASDWAWLKTGQWKTALSRQFNNSSSKLQFPDRSIASEEHDLGRQQGIGTGGKLGKLTWTAAAFNGLSEGEGRNRPGVDTKVAGVASLRWAAMGEMNAYEEGDIDATGSHVISLGAGAAWSEDELATDVNKNLNISADANWKYQGWSAHGEYFYREEDFDFSEDLETNSFYGQIGYFLEPQRWEIAGRYSLVNFDDAAEADSTEEWSASVNYYWWKHQLKAQLGYTYLIEDFSTVDSPDLETKLWIFQVSSWF